jgi:hypothetical protein
MNTALKYSTRVVQEVDRRCKKSTLNELVHLTPLRIPLMNPPSGCVVYPLNNKSLVAANLWYILWTLRAKAMKYPLAHAGDCVRGPTI